MEPNNVIQNTEQVDIMTTENPFTIGPFDSQFYWIYLSNDWDKSPGDISITQSFTGELSENPYYALEWPLNSNKYNFEIKQSGASFKSDNFSKKNEMKLEEKRRKTEEKPKRQQSNRKTRSVLKL